MAMMEMTMISMQTLILGYQQKSKVRISGLNSQDEQQEALVHDSQSEGSPAFEDGHDTSQKLKAREKGM